MFRILTVVACLIPVTAIILTVLSVYIITKQKSAPSMFVYLGLLYFVAAVVGILIWLVTIFVGGDSHGDFIPPSIFLMLPAILAMPLSFLCAIALSVWAYLRGIKKKERLRKLTIPVFLVNAVLIPAFLVPIPVFAVAPLEEQCNTQNRQTGEQIVAAMESYRQDHGFYPARLEALVPEHFSAVPQDHCDPFDMREYRIKECPSGVVLLTIETMVRDRYQRYNLQAEVWSESPLPVGDWLDVSKWDFVCNDLE